MQNRPIIPGQKVQIEGVGEICVVLRVDHLRHLADLLRLGTLRKVETGIPLALLTPADDLQQMEDDLMISA
ncbi:hypothetical protein [Occallatibacter riparius]|uniref:Uncharacterized protein n=1 Tax=Occallatibacter riparius TaxID=1002689 RepID=A0A9J7BU58_9BACT|nr:hypothetical protein [Occallatibacter riparius]UWZ86419.1 hypothetical protein MOP44_10850 [Occallatibacter riparius]